MPPLEQAGRQPARGGGRKFELARVEPSIPNEGVAVKELDLRYHNPKTIIFTIYPYYDNLN